MTCSRTWGEYYRPYSTPDRPRPRDVDELVEVVGLTDHVDQKILTLSGGQRRRLDVAIGIIGRPELLFLDEPTAGFDPHARREFRDLVHRLADFEDTTVLLTTHDLDEADKVADRILVLAAGRIVADGSGGLPRLLARPRDAIGLPARRSAGGGGGRVLADLADRWRAARVGDRREPARPEGAASHGAAAVRVRRGGSPRAGGTVGEMTDSVHNRIALLRSEQGVTRRQLADARRPLPDGGLPRTRRVQPEPAPRPPIAQFFDVPVEVVFSIEPFPRVTDQARAA